MLSILAQMAISSKKITTVTRRRREFFVLRRRFRFNLFCELCETDGEFITIDDAVLFSNLTTREIVCLVERNEIHFLETIRGHLFVCRQSLSEKQSPFLELTDGEDSADKLIKNI